MNFNAITVTMFGIGAILLYSGIKDKSPKDVVTNAFSPKNTKSPNKAKTVPPSNGPNASNPGTQRDFAQPFITTPVYPSN